MTRLEYSCQHVRTITYVGHGGEAHMACSACGAVTWRGTVEGWMSADGWEDADPVAALLKSIPGVKP